MTRLESFIRRMIAQKECLDFAINKVGSLEGHVLEIGLGNGRTYDHLRYHLKNKQIFVFDRALNAHPNCIPPQNTLILGDLLETFPAFAQQYPHQACLIHLDIGSGDIKATQDLVHFLTPYLAKLICKNGLILSDQELAPFPKTLPLPQNVENKRYFIYQA